jgi:hypothetical protein
MVTGKYYDYLASSCILVHLGTRFYMMVFMLESLLYCGSADLILLLSILARQEGR